MIFVNYNVHLICDSHFLHGIMRKKIFFCEFTFTGPLRYVCGIEHYLWHLLCLLFNAEIKRFLIFHRSKKSDINSGIALHNSTVGKFF